MCVRTEELPNKAEDMPCEECLAVGASFIRVSHGICLYIDFTSVICL